jgi:hypothetical protein
MTQNDEIEIEIESLGLLGEAATLSDFIGGNK